MSDGANFKEFYRILLENSVSKDIPNAILEWDFIENYKEENHCICGHKIIENMLIKNKLNYKTLIVGNVCINKFLNKDYDFIIKGIKSINENKTPNKNFINYCYNKGYIYENQKDFLLKIYRKRRLSEKQINFKTKILYKLKLRSKY